jgi:hypothetical protein
MSRAATHFETLTGTQASIEEDFHGWLTHQAALLRSRDADALDWEHLAEEIEAMASAERRELLGRARHRSEAQGMGEDSIGIAMDYRTTGRSRFLSASRISLKDCLTAPILRH